MNLDIMTPPALRGAYETDLREAFPPSELKPLADMEGMRERGIYEPLCLTEDGGEAAGYMLLWKHPEEPYVLVDYLCVPARLRGRGVGGTLFRMACAHAKKAGAEKLYISAHSAAEVMAAYWALGCVEAEEIDPRHAAAEPCDVQLERLL